MQWLQPPPPSSQSAHRLSHARHPRRKRHQRKRNINCLHKMLEGQHNMCGCKQDVCVNATRREHSPSSSQTQQLKQQALLLWQLQAEQRVAAMKVLAASAYSQGDRDHPCPDTMPRCRSCSFPYSCLPPKAQSPLDDGPPEKSYFKASSRWKQPSQRGCVPCLLFLLALCPKNGVLKHILSRQRLRQQKEIEFHSLLSTRYA